MSYSVTVALTAAIIGSMGSSAEALAADESATAVVVMDRVSPECHSGYVPADVSVLLNLKASWIESSAADGEQVTVELASATAQRSQRSVSTVAARRQEAEQAPIGGKPEEITPETASVHDLFSPMHELTADGVSSAPPALPEDASVDSLAQPQTLAPPYLRNTVPTYYSTTGYGTRRPPRNTHRFYSHPLYFEEVNLERCGRSKGCCTTACSVLHFATRAAMTPYLLTLQHHDDCVATLPDCPTCHKFGCDATCPEWSLKAAIVQGAAVTGIIYAIP